MRIFLTNLGKYNEGELIGQWLDLPCSDEEIAKTLKPIGIDERYEEYFITDYENDFGLEIGEYESISLLNEIAESIASLTDSEKTVLCAVLELEVASLAKVQGILDTLGEYWLNPDISNEHDLGYYYVHEAGSYDLEKMGELAGYIDYEAFGRDINLNSGGNGFTSYGWLERR